MYDLCFFSQGKDELWLCVSLCLLVSLYLSLSVYIPLYPITPIPWNVYMCMCMQDEGMKIKCLRFFSICNIISNHYRVQHPLHVDHEVLADCNTRCSCLTNTWDPVCGNNGLAYMSACLAGCEKSVGTGTNMVRILAEFRLMFCVLS